MKLLESQGNLEEVFKQLSAYYNTIQKSSLKDKNIQLINNYNLKPEEGLIHADFVRLRQVLTNLIDNAVKFTNKGFVEYGCFIHDNNVLFYIKDTGLGISSDKHSLIFDRFRQVDDSPSRQFGGAGLGLSISKGIVTLMKGDIWVESEPEKGSIFYFTIPYKPSATTNEKVHEQHKTSVSLSKKHVLIIEDDSYNVQYLKEVLEQEDAVIHLAESAKEAIQFLKENSNIDLILLDILLPDEGGIDLARKIRGKYPEIKILAQTAYASANDREQCLDAGCNGFISKPYSIKLIKQAIISILS